MEKQSFFKDFGEWYLSKQFFEKIVFNKYIFSQRIILLFPPFELKARTNSYWDFSEITFPRIIFFNRLNTQNFE